ncbi:dihydrolipoyl dehydrogenase [Bacteroidales bacterium OttesenSCG-928-B11]|nr:dihydrolipoyl dehydrogenase [Bacteroidales bacterium OttesenSCG-928-E04]MDL2308760.1 dihydrolipoyl dehydrogenase [Bacteroidales bacterium OttesenSCG-928-C03]MDL2312157.1 dihydrolipoyl dehydrogenase [Bacteroidales bacterium OttesenSCG-928-B11]
MKYDLIVIGSGPGGYVAAIRASQLNMKVAVVEKAEIGGICLNWGCIPTKALLKSAAVLKYAQHAADYGITIGGEVKPDFEAVVKRSRNVAETMSKGVQFLLKKNNVDVLQGFGKLLKDNQVEVTTADQTTAVYEANHIILATGARSRILPSIPQDGKRIIGYREALTLPKLPESMVVVGSGAIGSEFAYFYSTMGTKVTIVEYLPNLVPVEDEDISKQIERSFRKAGIKVMTSAAVESVDLSGDLCKVTIKDSKDRITEIECEVVLSAVGVATNIEGLGLEECGVTFEKGKVLVDDYYRTNVPGVYAIGDIVHGPALAHVASHEALVCVENIAGVNTPPVDYKNIPGCTYTTPEVASVGMTEKQCVEQGIEILVGKFPFTASGKATASGNRDGMAKVIFDKATGEWLGCHLVGENVTEMISGAVLARAKKTTGHDIIHAVHPHPTLSEAIMEAAAAAYGEVVHL